MGTTSRYNTTVADERISILKGFEFSNERITSTIVGHTKKWALQKLTFADGRIEMVPVWLNIYRRGNEVCEKLMDATCDPYQYDCPKKFIELSKQHPPRDAEGNVLKYYAQWLEKAEAYETPKSIKVEFNKNYTLTNGMIAFIVGEYNRACWLGYVDGVRYKIKKNTIKAEVK